ncbi:L-aspartate oxidase [Mariprofundus ferrinatatus]|uniref:L-aspartate oxidase n=1 Tax=Mariprofundus ferrinatatus TaxID=1921087 RepID=A0A2K8L1C0_9PROT|nr:L-aspartate oxidase [Mariprofundus ferrinatatus]ATX81115.1 L-aspartate oxidase [Mariprofundus ferrinatatus]
MGSSKKRLQADYLIIGSGAAGLLAARRLAEHGKVILVNKGSFRDSNTWNAQGGIAGVLSSSDSVASHVQDTLKAGAGLCHPEVVQAIVARGREIIDELIAIGTCFDRKDGELHLTQEGGHSSRRVAHAQDATGRAIGEALLSKVAPHPNILRLEQHTAIDLITTLRIGHGTDTGNRCLGAYILAPEGHVVTVEAAHTVLATGGAGKVYLYTSNPHAATGDGIAMAWRAGCPVMNLEFIQFHPTCLFHRQGSNMLLSEALRGEGAHLVDSEGRRFMFDYDAQGELAPRDIVARAIDHEIKKQGADCMYLDARPIGRDQLLAHFPNIHERLLKLGMDITTQPIPVVPAAHYICGGIKAEINGRTAIDALYAIGETACTGLHGANRLASNSLLECLVMAECCASDIITSEVPDAPPIPTWDDTGIVPETERIQIKQNWDEIRATMSHYVGIVRSDERLRRAKRRLHVIREEIASYYWKHPVSQDLLELRNIELIAELIIASALQRHESRGLHYSTDHTGTDPEARDTILWPNTL